MRAVENFNLGLYDSDTGKTIETMKAVELRAPNGERVILAYGIAVRGRLVQITSPHDDTDGGPTIGAHIHFFLSEIGWRGRSSADDAVASIASRLGLSRSALVRLLRDNQPSPEFPE